MSSGFLIWLTASVACLATPDSGNTAPSDSATVRDSQDVTGTTDTTDPVDDLLVTIAPNPSLANDLVLTATTTTETSLSAHCVAETDPSEAHLFRGSPATDHEQHLSGLLADTTYRCEVMADDGRSTDVTATTGPLPTDLPTLTVTGTGTAWGHYTLFNHWDQAAEDDQTNLTIVDMEGRVRWYHQITERLAAGVDLTLVADRLLLAGGGRGLEPTFITEWGEVVWTGPGPDTPGKHHHDVTLLDSGELMTLSTAENQAAGVTWEGFVIELRQAWTGELTWSWNSQDAVDAGTLPPSSNVDNPVQDVYHANALTWVDDEEGEAIWVSLKRLNRMIRIDRASGAVVRQLGDHQAYRLQDPAGNALERSDWFFGQHDPELVGDELLVHDNGLDRPGEDYTRVVAMTVDHTALTATVTWQYTEEGWMEEGWGDADRLPNGHVLVSMGHCHDCELGDPDRRTRIREVDPGDNSVVWSLDFAELTDAVYRAERVHGCDLFASLAACPELAD